MGTSMLVSCFIYYSLIFIKGNAASDILDSLLVDYDRRILPHDLENPVQVNMSAHILSVENIDEENHEFTVTMYLRHFWSDSRLKFDPTTAGMSTISLKKEEEDKLWKPDTFVVNGKSYEESNSFLKISSNGDITSSAKVNIIASCKMTFGFFPHDRHVCSLFIESYGHNDDDIIFSWKNGSEAITIGEDASPPNFEVAAYNTDETVEPTGNYRRISLDMYIVRKSNRKLPDLYFPAIALTLTSFFSLWSGSRQSRIQISVLCLLGIIFFMAITYTRRPNVSFQTAVEHYQFLCANLILNVVIVNCILYNFLNPRQGYRKDCMNNSEMKEIKTTNGIVDEHEKHDEDKNYDGPPYVSSKFQKFLLQNCQKTKWHLPIAFAIFNVIYVLVVLIAPKGYPDGFIHLHN